MSVSYRLGFDIGGTFTDFTLVNESPGEILVEKCLTSPHDPGTGGVDGIKKLAAEAPEFLAATREAIHATTLLTNVAIERNGARTGLIATKGFRDILEIGQEVRYDLYDLLIRFLYRSCRVAYASGSLSAFSPMVLSTFHWMRRN